MRRSIGLPLTIGILLGVLALVLAIAWNVVVVSDLGGVAEQLTALHWVLLVLGSLFFLLLIAGLALLCAWLVREMRQNQHQQAFLDAVTHEMKTPLASLRLYVDTLRRHDLGPERQGEFLGRMGEDVDRLEDTVQQVLAAARAATRARRPRLEPVTVSELLGECVEELRDRYGLEPDALRLDVDGSPTALANREELAIVFRNLLDNAIKYSGDAVRVRVRVAEEAEAVSVEIRDSGVGIPRRELRRIFKPFYRTGRDVQQAVKGLGLGLFIVRYLLRRQGGRVEARSEGPGQGSRFAVRLRPAPVLAPRALEVHAEHPGR